MLGQQAAGLSINSGDIRRHDDSLADEEEPSEEVPLHNGGLTGTGGHVEEVLPPSVNILKPPCFLPHLRDLFVIKIPCSFWNLITHHWLMFNSTIFAP